MSEPAPEDASPTRWPALDGLRGVAVLAVIGFHYGVLRGGYLGVDLFFVLSGFLITSLLIQEWDKRGGSISFRDFYMRRFLRLFPALGCVLAFSVVLALGIELSGPPGARPYATGTLGELPWVVAFAGNWVQAFSPASALGSPGLLGHTWSLAIEEQFYLLWPVLFVLLMRGRLSRGFMALILAFTAAAEMVYQVAMAFAGYGNDRIYYGTDTHSEGLLIGCAIAFWLSSRRRRGRVPGLPGAWGTRSTGLAAAVVLVLFVSAGRLWAPVAIPLAVLACGVILAGVVTGRLPAVLERILCYEPSVRIGRRSYGLYLWQYAMLQAAIALFPAGFQGNDHGLVTAAVIGALFFALFAVVELSYRYVELPALRLKRRFRWDQVSSRRGAGNDELEQAGRGSRP